MPSKLTLNRRLFLKGVTGGTAGIMAGCWINLAPAGAMITGASMELSESFLNPPTDARPWVYWFWINGNITKEGMICQQVKINIFPPQWVCRDW